MNEMMKFITRSPLLFAFTGLLATGFVFAQVLPEDVPVPLIEEEVVTEEIATSTAEERTEVSTTTASSTTEIEESPTESEIVVEGDVQLPVAESRVEIDQTSLEDLPLSVTDCRSPEAREIFESVGDCLKSVR